MKKHILTILLMAVITVITAACGRRTPDGKADLSADEHKETGTVQQKLLSSMIANPKVVFEETSKDLLENNGEYIAADAERKTSQDGVTFYAGSDENPFLAFSKSQEGTTGNQAFYVMCLPPARNFGFMLTAAAGIGITIGDEGEPSFFLQYGSYVEPIVTDLRIEPGNWYHVLLATDATGAIQGAICKDGAADQAAYFSVPADKTEGENRIDQSWELHVGFRGESTFTVKNYSLYTFENFANPAE